MSRPIWSLCLFVAAALCLPVVSAPAPRYHEVGRIALEGSEGWDYLFVDSEARRLYVSHGTHVVVVNIDTRKAVGEIKNTPGVHGIALDPSAHHGFTSNGQEDSVTVFDTRTLAEVERVKVGKRPDAILYDPASKRVFTFNAGSQDATAIDAATLKVVGTIPLGAKPEFAVTDGKGGLWVNLEDKSQIASLDPRKLTVKAAWPLAPAEEPSGLALDRAHRLLYAVCGNKKMAVVNADSGKLVTTLEIGQGPDAALYDPATHLAFSSNGQDGTLNVIQQDSAGVHYAVSTLPTEVGARTMALDPKTHQIFLATAKAQPVPAGQPAPRRRTYVPGSFTIVVFGP